MEESNLSDGDSETHDVTAGEQEGADGNPDDQEIAILRRIEQSKYQSVFANFDDDASESRIMQMRRSSEFMGRRSITSKMMMRRSSTFVPGFSQAESGDYTAKRTVSEFPHARPDALNVPASSAMAKANSQQPAKTDPVTDIVDDAEILKKKQQEQPQTEALPGKTNGRASDLFKDSKALEINDFDADLKRHNEADLATLPPSPTKPDLFNMQAAPKRERSGWGTKQATPILQTDIANSEEFKGFQARGKPIDTRPTFVAGAPHQGVGIPLTGSHQGGNPLAVSEQVTSQTQP